MWINSKIINVDKPYVIEAKKLVKVFKNMVNCHANRLKEINILKHQLYDYMYPAYMKTEDTDNKIDEVIDMDKVLGTIQKIFSILHLELLYLKTDVKVQLFHSILYYEECDEYITIKGSTEVKISKFLHILLELSYFVRYCKDLHNEIHCQLINIFEFQLINDDINFQGIFEYIGDILYLFVELDNIIILQPVLQKHWIRYQRCLNNIRLDSAKYVCDLNDIAELENICNDIDFTLLSGKNFERVLNSDFTGKINVQKCYNFLNEFKLYLKNVVLLLGQPSLQKCNDPLQMWSRICSTTVFYTNIFGVFDKKLLKQFMDLLEKVNHIPLEGNIVWDPEDFVLQYIGHLLKPNKDKKKPGNLEKCVSELVDITKTFSKTTTSSIQQTTFDSLKDIYDVTYPSDKATKQNIYNSFIDEMRVCLNHQIFKPMNTSIENELRLQVMTIMTNVNFKKTLLNRPIDKNIYMIKLQPMQFLDSLINTKSRAENYLSETFYDLTSVALHDWHNNGVMRTLAKHKHNLETVDDKLQNHTLEQGIDVLAIMRNLNVFVAKYSYNLSRQVFIENDSTSKDLNTINIQHISNSIRIHGTGIMSTTLNSTYQLICGKLNMLSKYLYDENVKSKLKKEISFLHEIQKTNNTKYPFERAEKCNSSLRQLKLDSNENYIDELRILVTHIGNALGYGRMVKSGGLHFCSMTTSFMAHLKKNIKFQELCRSSGFTKHCLDSARHLDNVVDSIHQNIAECTYYFKLLIEVFDQAMSSDNNSHLHNFYILVPALSLNYVQHSINSKEKMIKKSKGDMFTDDGFPVGVAFLLRILDPKNKFDSLEWFQSVSENYQQKSKLLKSKKMKALKDDAKLQQPLSLSYTRSDVYEKAFTQLYFQLNDSRLFLSNHI